MTLKIFTLLLEKQGKRGISKDFIEKRNLKVVSHVLLSGSDVLLNFCEIFPQAFAKKIQAMTTIATKKQIRTMEMA